MGHCEIDRFAERSYRALFDTRGEWFCEDVQKAKPNELPEFDLLCAGFPCQPYSVAGTRRGFADPRGNLFFEITRLVEAGKPSYLLLENVPGLLSHDGGRTFASILHALDGLGYGVEWQVLDSKDFHVPQSRRRVYLIGFWAAPHHENGGAFRQFCTLILLRFLAMHLAFLQNRAASEYKIVPEIPLVL